MIQRACLDYLRNEPRRKPTPGEIYTRASRLMPKPQIVPPQEPERIRVSAENAAEILARAGFAAKRFGGAS